MATSFFARLINEPLIQFLIIALFIFAADSYVLGKKEDPRRIVIDDTRLQELIDIFREGQGRDPSADEINNIVVNDLDGRLDLLQANGHLEEEIGSVDPSQEYRQAAQLFWNAGLEGGFVAVDPESTGDLSRPIVGRGAAYADIDDDGDLDVALTQVGGEPLLLRNEQSTGHHWLRLELLGAAPNLDAIGAWVEVEAGGVVQRRQVMPTRSYQSQVEKALTFGLGTHTTLDRVEVFWPDGESQRLEGLEIDRLHRVRREAG